MVCKLLTTCYFEPDALGTASVPGSWTPATGRTTASGSNTESANAAGSTAAGQEVCAAGGLHAPATRRQNSCDESDTATPRVQKGNQLSQIQVSTGAPVRKIWM